MSGRYFTKSERAGFGYWFSHWCAFQLTALRLGCWKFRFLFHDIEKPWLRLFLPYEKVQKIHRKRSRHHLEYFRNHTAEQVDWLAMVIDWECSPLTKWDAPRNAVDTLNHLWSKLGTEYHLSEEKCSVLQFRIRQVLRKLNIYEATTYFSRPLIADKVISRMLRTCAHVTVVLVDWPTALRSLKLTRLMKNDGRDKDLYITPDGCSYVLKHDCADGMDCQKIIVFTHSDQALNRLYTILKKSFLAYDTLNWDETEEVRKNLNF